VLINKKL